MQSREWSWTTIIFAAKIRSETSAEIDDLNIWYYLLLACSATKVTQRETLSPGAVYDGQDLASVHSYIPKPPPSLFLGHKNAKGKISEIINWRKKNPSAKFWEYLGDSQVKLLFHLFYYMWVCGNYELSSKCYYSVCCKNMHAVPHFATLLFGTMDFWHARDTGSCKTPYISGFTNFGLLVFARARMWLCHASWCLFDCHHGSASISWAL